MADAHCIDPLAVFRAAVAAASRDAWREVAGYCDPVSLRWFQRQRINWILSVDSRRPMSVDEFLKHQPDMPHEVAQYHVATINADRDPAQRLREEFPDVHSIDELRALDATTAYAKWLEGRSLRRQIDRLVATGRMTEPDGRRVDREAIQRRSTHVAVGVVYDGDQLAHVLYRLASAPGTEGTQKQQWLLNVPPEDRAACRDVAERRHASVALCRRQPDHTWRVWADDAFPGSDGMLVITPDVDAEIRNAE